MYLSISFTHILALSWFPHRVTHEVDLSLRHEVGRLPERELLVECVTSVEYDVKCDANVCRYNILIYAKDLQSKPKSDNEEMMHAPWPRTAPA